MINYTVRLDSALRKAAWAHEQTGQHRKGTDIPYIIHPVAVMIIASNITDDEDILIACLLHDILEDVDGNIYDGNKMRDEFGDRVLSIVKNVTKNKNETDWRARSEEYLLHLENEASDEAIILCASDKLHNLVSILIDYSTYGDNIWDRFTTKSGADQLWWYESILRVIIKRNVSEVLSNQLAEQVRSLRDIITKD